MSTKKSITFALALFFALLIPILGYLFIGFFYAVVFFVGYIGGFVSWMLFKSSADWEQLKAPY